MTGKITVILLAVMLLSSFGPLCVAEEPSAVPGTVDLPYAGLTFTPPEAYRDTKGQILTDGAIELIPGIQYAYWLYCAVAEDEIYTLYNNPNVSDVATPLFYVFSIGKGMSFDEMNGMLGGTLSAGEVYEIGQTGEYTFYFYTEGPDLAFADGIGEAYAAEYIDLAGLTEPVAAAFAYYEPVDRYAALIGSKIEFTTADLDGNTVSSADLFARSEVTVLNIWATWCGPCIGELADLQKIHLRLQEKDCGVVGLLADRDFDAARSLIAKHGVAYPVVLSPDNLDALITLEGYPTTLFIGRDGTVLAAPIVGAYVSEYENTVDALLTANQ